MRSNALVPALALLATLPLAAQEPASPPAAAPAPAVAPAVAAALPDPTRPVVTLAEAIRLSTRVQPGVVQARSQIRNAGAQRRAARAAYLPTVTATSSGGYAYSEAARNDPLTGEFINGSSTTVAMALSASVDLFTGFRRGADVRVANAQVAAADAGVVDAEFQQRLATTNQFFDALAASQLLRVRESSVRRAEEQLKVSAARLRAGTATRSDSLRSLVTLGTARLDLVTARSTLAAEEAALGRLAGAETRVAAADDSTFYRLVTAVDTSVLRVEAAERSPQVRSTVASADAARAGLASVRSQYWPTLNLGGSYSFNGSNQRDYDLLNQRQLSLQLRWPIFNGFVRERSVAQQESTLEVAEAEAEDARRQVVADLTGALAQLDAARERIDITGTSVTAAEEDLRVQQERYRLGASTIVDVLTSQEALVQAEVNVVNARFDYLRAKAQIEALIGRNL